MHDVVKRGSTVIYYGTHTTVTDSGLISDSMYTYTVEAYDANNKLLDACTVTEYTTQFELNASVSAAGMLTYSGNHTGHYVVKRNGVTGYRGTVCKHVIIKAIPYNPQYQQQPIPYL